MFASEIIDTKKNGMEVYSSGESEVDEYTIDFKSLSES